MNLTMASYHVHVTVKNKLILIPKGWKSTDIILLGKREQTDYMITKYYATGHKGIMLIQDILDDVKSLPDQDNIVRIKLEQTSNFNIPISEINYVEVHLKCVQGTVLDNPNWVMSRNPSESRDGKLLFFYNRRIYSGLNHQAVFDLIDSEITGIPFIEMKIEQVVFDTEKSIDGWWA